MASKDVEILKIEPSVAGTAAPKPSQSAQWSGLSDLQLRFVHAYTQKGAPTFGNAYQSALAAGYSEASARTKGGKIKETPAVKAAIQARMLDQARSTNDPVTSQQLDRLERMGRFKTPDAFEAELDVAGNPTGRLRLRDLTQIDRDSIKAIKLKNIMHKGVVVAQDVELVGYDAQAAIKLHMQATGKFKEATPNRPSVHITQNFWPGGASGNQPKNITPEQKKLPRAGEPILVQ